MRDKLALASHARQGHRSIEGKLRVELEEKEVSAMYQMHLNPCNVDHACVAVSKKSRHNNNVDGCTERAPL